MVKCQQAHCGAPAVYVERSFYAEWDPWRPLCWSHALGNMILMGHENARYAFAFASIGYAEERGWALDVPSEVGAAQ